MLKVTYAYKSPKSKKLITQTVFAESEDLAYKTVPSKLVLSGKDYLLYGRVSVEEA